MLFRSGIGVFGRDGQPGRVIRLSGRLWLPGFENDPVSRKGGGVFLWGYGGYRTRAIVGKMLKYNYKTNFVNRKLGVFN